MTSRRRVPADGARRSAHRRSDQGDSRIAATRGAPARADRRCIFGVSLDHAVSIALPDLRGKVDKRDTAV